MWCAPRWSLSSELRGLVSHKNASDVRQEIRQTYELSPGARVELSGLNGAVKIETSDTQDCRDLYRTHGGDARKHSTAAKSRSKPTRTACVFVVKSRTMLVFSRDSLVPPRSERTTLKLPRQIALYAKGVNGPFIAGDIDGPVEVTGINGSVQIGSAVGSATVQRDQWQHRVGLKKIDLDGVTLSGINGNIELQLGADVNADFDARGLNGRVISDLPNVEIEKSRRRSYTARIGNGGSRYHGEGD